MTTILLTILIAINLLAVLSHIIASEPGYGASDRAFNVSSAGFLFAVFSLIFIGLLSMGGFSLLSAFVVLATAINAFFFITVTLESGAAEG